MTHLLHPDDDKWDDLGDVEHRRVDRDTHVSRWEEANRVYLEKSDMGQVPKKEE